MFLKFLTVNTRRMCVSFLLRFIIGLSLILSCDNIEIYNFTFCADPMYTSFHDEEWGVPVNDDRNLFELLVFSQALAELSWPTILNKRDIFRYLCLYYL